MARPHAAILLAISVAWLAGIAGPAASADWELRICADPDNMPFSNSAGEGFDNRIGALIAADLDAELTWVWLPDPRGRTRLRYLQGGECDMVLGVIEGQPGMLTSYAYYRTGYVFLYRDDAPFQVSSLDDAVLRDLRIGLQDGGNRTTSPSIALANRGILENQVRMSDGRVPGRRYLPVIEAFDEGLVDLAIAWGPVAGDYARAEGGVVVAPVRPEIDVPFIPMVASVAVGVRPEDRALRDDIDRALSRTWPASREILQGAGVPLIDMPPPAPPGGG